MSKSLDRYEICTKDNILALRNICKNIVYAAKPGARPKNFTTASWDLLRIDHKEEYALVLEENSAQKEQKKKKRRKPESIL